MIQNGYNQAVVAADQSFHRLRYGTLQISICTRHYFRTTALIAGIKADRNLSSDGADDGNGDEPPDYDEILHPG